MSALLERILATPEGDLQLLSDLVGECNGMSSLAYCGRDIVGQHEDGSWVIPAEWENGATAQRHTWRRVVLIALARLCARAITFHRISCYAEPGDWKLAQQIDGVLHVRPELRRFREQTAACAFLCEKWRAGLWV